MKHIATVPAAIVKAAMLFQAKQDVRYYLNGFYITNDHIVATDGYTMFVCPYESDLCPEKPMIIAINGKISVKATILSYCTTRRARSAWFAALAPHRQASRLLTQPGLNLSGKKSIQNQWRCSTKQDTQRKFSSTKLKPSIQTGAASFPRVSQCQPARSDLILITATV